MTRDHETTTSRLNGSVYEMKNEPPCSLDTVILEQARPNYTLYQPPMLPRLFTIRLVTSNRGEPTARPPDRLYSNVPRTVVEHDPEGYDWGAATPGAQELALNILNLLYPPKSDGLEPLSCRIGSCSRLAKALEVPFRQSFIDKAHNKDGKRVPVKITDVDLRDWLKKRGLDLYTPNFPPTDKLLVSLGIALDRCKNPPLRSATAC